MSRLTPWNRLDLQDQVGHPGQSPELGTDNNREELTLPNI